MMVCIVFETQTFSLLLYYYYVHYVFIIFLIIFFTVLLSLILFVVIEGKGSAHGLRLCLTKIKIFH